jgi:hypothetical protein
VAQAFGIMEGAVQTLGLLRAEISPAAGLLAEALARRCTHAVEGLLLAFGWEAGRRKDHSLRDQLMSFDPATREAAVETLGQSVASSVAARLLEARRAAAQEAAKRRTLADSVHPHLFSADSYVRVAAMYLLDEHSAIGEEQLKDMARDEHDVVCETAVCLLMRAHHLESREQTGLVTVERMMALRSVPLFASLAPPELASLARASIEKEFAPGKTLCLEGEPGDEVFILLAGEVKVVKRDGPEERVVGSEKAGGFIEELAVLDSAPRAASVLAGSEGARVLCLRGKAFREVLRTNPSLVSGVIQVLAARIRGARVQPQPAEELPLPDSGKAGAGSSLSAR